MVLMAVGAVPRSRAISGVATMMEVLMRVMGRDIQQTTARMTQRRQVGMAAALSSDRPGGGGGEDAGGASGSAATATGSASSFIGVGGVSILGFVGDEQKDGKKGGTSVCNSVIWWVYPFF